MRNQYETPQRPILASNFYDSSTDSFVCPYQDILQRASQEKDQIVQFNKNVRNKILEEATQMMCQQNAPIKGSKEYFSYLQTKLDRMNNLIDQYK